MKRLATFAGLALAGGAAFAQGLQPPEIAAREYLLIDMNAGQVLAERAADTAVDPSSLTKLMTAYLVFVALKEHKLALDQKMPVSARALAERRSGASLMYLDAATPATVDELLQGLIVDAGNDAAVALAEGVGGSVDGFVAMMNRQAQAWGLKNTTFRNASGLAEPGHRSSARDLAAIAQHVVRDFPEHYHYYGQRDFKYHGFAQDNRNILLRRDASVDGLGTGFTESAGYGLLASAQRDFPNGKRRLMAVVLGTGAREARADDAQKLLNWGYTAFDDVRLVEAGKAVGAPVAVWKGTQAQVGLGSADAIYVAVPKGEGDRLKTTVERTDPLVAPLAKGQRVGSLKVTTASGTAIATIALTVLEDVPQAGLLGRAWDAIRLWIK